ncbi:DUF5018 domain-containing protein [uncultured Aquimarina sp.]|uniref:DUF5018 domain-containing protein n=1 Tax=uncultured Aquimarina sp. TaxID=575652 RepID=UPI002631F5B5|nr:DUF5018 domain-containing protein [uncultured Aquimarina sp.]
MNIRILTCIFSILLLISCSSDDDTPLPLVLSSGNTITDFKLTINDEVFSGLINQNDKTISFNFVGAELSSLVPTIEYSEKAAISPKESEPQNFNEEVSYTVIAENGESNIYRVIIENRPLSNENKILEFSVTDSNDETLIATINEELKIIEFDLINTDLNGIIPQILISEYATITPDLETPINFNETVSYTVTAENGDESIYNVRVNAPEIETISARYFNSKWVYSNAELWISGKFLNPQSENFNLYLTDGITNFNLEVLSSESYESLNTRIYNLFVKMPENITSNDNYKVVYENSDFVSESIDAFNISSDNIPVVESLDKEFYNVDDTVLIKGINLTEQLAIPNNGSIFLVDDCCGTLYNYQLNQEKTELSFKLDRQVYGWTGPVERTITLLGDARRVGQTVRTNFGSTRYN